MQKEYIREKILKLAKKLDKTPKLSEIKQYIDIPKSQIVKYWGGYTEFCYAVGLIPNKHHLSNQKALKQLEKFANQLGRIPKKEDIDKCSWLPRAATYFNKFGGIRKALYKINLIPAEKIPENKSPTKYKSFSDQQAIKVLISLARELQKVPSSREINNCPYTPSTGLYQKRFNSLTNILKETGIYYNRIKDKYLEDDKSPYIF